MKNMQTHWIHRQQNNTLLLFFSGWGSDHHPFTPILAHDVDVLMLYDYRQLQLPDDFKAITASYQKITILAWSLGVWVANQLMKECDIVIDRAIAVNGTLNPVDDLEGIPVAVFDGTLQNLNVINMVKFNRRMFANNQHQLLFQQNMPQRPVDDLAHELSCLRSSVTNVPNHLFTNVLVSDDDRIFPSGNQMNFWKDKLPVDSASPGHFPFYGYESWDQIIALA
jgi:biotin synthesis protein BioG